METNNQDQVKDLQYFKDEVAREYTYQGVHYARWENMEARLLRGIPEGAKTQGTKDLILRLAEAAERYAAHKVQQAKDAAFKEGCEAQKIVCALYAMLDTSDFVDDRLKTMPFEIEGGGEGIISIDEDSILKAPNAKSPYTTGEKGGEE